jgi:hypothetical protein
MMSTILHEVLAIARPAIVSMMTAGLGGAMQPEPPQSPGSTPTDGPQPGPNS